LLLAVFNSASGENSAVWRSGVIGLAILALLLLAATWLIPVANALLFSAQLMKQSNIETVVTGGAGSVASGVQLLFFEVSVTRASNTYAVAVGGNGNDAVALTSVFGDA
jgi:hypothetical protein